MATLIDAEALSRRAGGNPEIEREMLALFTQEAERLLRQAERSIDAETRGQRLSALARTARNVGALVLADAAHRASKDWTHFESVRHLTQDTIAAVQAGRY